MRTEPYSAIVVGILIVGGIAWGATTLPLQAVVILATAAILGYIGWMLTTYRSPVRSRRVIAVYLAAVAFQLIHMAEEYVGQFPHELVELFNSPREWSERSFLLVFVFGFGAIWVLAAAGALYQVRTANYLIWFYALGAGLINAISHFVFPVLKGGYFPGLYTAVGHLVMSIVVIWVLIAEWRAARCEALAGARQPASAAGR